MKLKILRKTNIFLTLVFAFLVCIISLNAASNRIEIVSTSGSIVDLGDGGGKISQSIISSNLEEGELTLELMLNNSFSTEVLFVVDNSTELTELDSGNVKKAINDSLKDLVGVLHDDFSNIKTGVLAMHPYGSATTDPENGGLIVGPSGKENTLTALTTLLNKEPVANGQDFIQVLSKANDTFTTDVENKIIALILTGIDESNINSYKEAITNLNPKINLITIAISDDATFLSQLFGSEEEPKKGTVYHINSEDITDTVSISLNDEIKNSFPENKYNILIENIFSEEILNNFKIEYSGNPSQGAVGEFNKTDKKFSWAIGNLINNNSATMRYKLILNDDVASSSLDKLLNTNEKIWLKYDDTLGNENENKDYESSPVIKLLIVNPKTGVYDYFIPASLLFCISVLTISLVKRKDVLMQI